MLRQLNHCTGNVWTWQSAGGRAVVCLFVHKISDTVYATSFFRMTPATAWLSPDRNDTTAECKQWTARTEAKSTGVAGAWWTGGTRGIDSTRYQLRLSLGTCKDMLVRRFGGVRFASPDSAWCNSDDFHFPASDHAIHFFTQLKVSRKCCTYACETICRASLLRGTHEVWSWSRAMQFWKLCKVFLWQLGEKASKAWTGSAMQLREMYGCDKDTYTRISHMNLYYTSMHNMNDTYYFTYQDHRCNMIQHMYIFFAGAHWSLRWGQHKFVVTPLTDGVVFYTPAKSGP